MLEQARRERAVGLINQCNIAGIANYDSEYKKELIESFEGMIPKSVGEELRELEEAEAAIIKGDNARTQMVAMFGRR